MVAEAEVDDVEVEAVVWTTPLTVDVGRCFEECNKITYFMGYAVVLWWRGRGEVRGRRGVGKSVGHLWSGVLSNA